MLHPSNPIHLTYHHIHLLMDKVFEGERYQGACSHTQLDTRKQKELSSSQEVQHLLLSPKVLGFKALT